MSKLFLSEVRVTPVPPRDSLLAFGSVHYRGELRISDLALHATPTGDDFTIAYPLKTLFNGAKVHIVYPTNPEVAEAIRIAVVGKYLELVQRARGEKT